jgi:membrane protein
MKQNPFVKTVLTVVSTVRRIHRWLERRRIRVYAAQASFFMTISALPMLILILSLAGMILPLGGGVRERLLSALPTELNALAETVLGEVEAKANLSVLSVSAVTLLWSASRGVRGIGAGIRNVCDGKRSPDPVAYHARYLLYTLLYIAAVLLSLVIWVFGDTIAARAAPGGPTRLLRLLNSSAFLILLVTVFLLTFRGMAGIPVKLFSQLPGAVFAAFGWLLYSRFFEFYIEHYANYSYIYGSLTSLIIVMLWLYACMELLLIGAGLNMLIARRVRVV